MSPIGMCGLNHYIIAYSEMLTDEESQALLQESDVDQMDPKEYETSVDTAKGCDDAEIESEDSGDDAEIDT